MEGYLDLLKGRSRSILMGISILWVMLFHLEMFGNLSHIVPIHFLFGRGYLGVDIFFFLSGYGLCYSFNNNSIKEFYKHRVKKLFPMYFVFLVILFVFFSASKGVSWIKIMLMQISGIATFAKLQVEWFIPALILLYLLFPLLYKAFEKLYKVGPITLIILILVVSTLNPLLNKVTIHLFPPRFVIFIVGIATYFMLKNNNVLCLISLYVVLALAGLMSYGIKGLGNILPGTLSIPIILFALGQMPQVNYKLKVLPFLGEHSLEIYLAQCIAFNYYMASSRMSFLKTVLFSIIIVPLMAIAFFFIQKMFYSYIWRNK